MQEAIKIIEPRRNQRSCRQGRCFLLAIFSAASTAAAELPRVMDRVPAEASASFAIPSFEQFDRHAGQMFAAGEMRTLSSPSQALGILGVRDALDLSQGFAGYVLKPTVPADRPDAILLLPTPSFKAYITAVGARPGDSDGIYTWHFREKTLFAREAGPGWTALSDDLGGLQRLVVLSGQLEQHEAHMSPTSLALAGEADFVLTVNAEHGHDLLRAAVPALQQTLADHLPASEFVVGEAGLLSRCAAALTEHARAVTITARCTSFGLHVDMMVDATAGTPLHEQASRIPEPREVLEVLPNTGYLLAAAVDARGALAPAVAALLEEDFRRNAPRSLPLAAAMALAQGIQSTRGGVLLTAGPLSALLRKAQIIIERQDERDLAEVIRRAMDDQLAPSEQTLQSSDLRISWEMLPPMNGAPIWRWTLPAMAGMSPARLILLGPGQRVSGLLSMSEERVLLVTQDDRAQLNELAARAAKPDAALAADPVHGQLVAMLPDDAQAIVLIGTEPLVTALRPMLAGAGVALDPPGFIPPVAIGFGAADGTLHLGAFVPAYALHVGYVAAPIVLAEPGP